MIYLLGNRLHWHFFSPCGIFIARESQKLCIEIKSETMYASVTAVV